MRTIQLHPLSVLVGLGIATLAFVAMAQSPTSLTPVQYRPQAPLPVIAARDMVQIKEGTPFVVPAGKLLVLTGVGRAQPAPYACHLLVNNVEEAGVTWFFNGNSSAELRGVLAVPPGLSIASGSVVTVTSYNLGNSDCRAWGYLADA